MDRVYINSHERVTLLYLNTVISTALTGSSINTMRPWGRMQSAIACQCLSICVVQKMASTESVTVAFSSSWRLFLWFRIVSAPKFLHHSTVTALDAVANTFKPAQRANCMAMEPTPPAPPMIRMFLPALAPGSGTKPKRSNKASHAVIDVRGMATASSGERFLGASAAMRSSTK